MPPAAVPGGRPCTAPGFPEPLREADFPATRPWGHCRRSGRVQIYPLRGCEGAFLREKSGAFSPATRGCCVGQSRSHIPAASPFRLELRLKPAPIPKLLPVALPRAAAAAPGPGRSCEAQRVLCRACRAGPGPGAGIASTGSPQKVRGWDLCLGQVNQRALHRD